MAVSITNITQHYPELFDDETRELIQRGQSPFDFPGLTLVHSVDESKAINHIKGTVIIIAGSGMATGGRIKHHLVTNLPRPESTILFVGYQAAGTLGRLILDGEKQVRVLGQEYPVRARIAQIHGLSAHADRDELLRWLAAFQKPPRRLFVTHGEASAASFFAQLVREKMGWPVSVPAYLDEVYLT